MMDDEAFGVSKHFVETGSGKIYYFLGQKFVNRPTAVFLHGLGSNHTTWLPLMQLFSQHHFNSLALEMRGHGLSDNRKVRSLYSFSSLVSDLKAVLDQEAISPCILVGYSYGGSVALDFVQTYPEFVSGLILISTNYVSPFQYRHLGFLAPIGYWVMNLAGYLMLWQKRKRYKYFDQSQQLSYWYGVWDSYLTLPVAINYWMLAEAIGFKVKKPLASIACPALIIRGDKDFFVTASEASDLAQKMPNARLQTVSSSSHFLAWKHQDKIVAVILEFVKTLI